MANLNAWAQTVVGRYIDVDQWVGNQCWDLAQLWLTVCNGGTLWTQPSRFPGLAAGSWEVATQNTANTADLLRHVTPIPGTERGLPGDIIIWAYGSADYPISHTAVLMEDRGPILRTISQNSSPPRPYLPGYSVESSGPTIYQDLTRAGILGFLRPRATITSQGTGFERIEEGFLMALTDQQQADIYYILCTAEGRAERAQQDANTLLASRVNMIDGGTPTVAELSAVLNDKTARIKADTALLPSFNTDVRGDLANKGAQIAGLAAAVQVLATSNGLDPAAVLKAVEKAAEDGVAGALSNLTAKVEIGATK